MSLFSRLAEKSWETPGATAYLDPATYRPAAARVGLWIYLGVATVLFALITAAYLMRMMTDPRRGRRCCGSTRACWCWRASYGRRRARLRGMTTRERCGTG
jgi:heme/copper-type cytochrome/quinol oxidase subunit 3